MADGECENCGKSINSKYKYCLDCMNSYKSERKEEIKESNKDICERLDKIADTLEKMNWNFGMLVATIRKDTKLVKKLIDNEN